MIKAVIFDMDGVLSDSEPLYHEAHNRVLADAGVAMTDEENEQIIGTTVEDSWRWIAARFDLDDIAAWIERYDRAVLEILGERVEPAPGLYELLDALAARGLPLGLASSSQRSWIDVLLDRLGIAARFHVIVSGDAVKLGKPDPEIYLVTAARLGERPGECLVLEDSPVGIAAAKDAGMEAVAVLTPQTAHLDLSRADRVIPSLHAFNLAWLADGE